MRKEVLPGCVEVKTLGEPRHIDQFVKALVDIHQDRQPVVQDVQGHKEDIGPRKNVGPWVSKGSAPPPCEHFPERH